MKCHKLTKENFKDSILGKQLLSIYPNLDIAFTEYEKLLSDEFINEFGDWVSNIDEVDNPIERYRGRLDNEGRPAIFKYEHKTHGYYVVLKDGSKKELEYEGLKKRFTNLQLNNIIKGILGYVVNSNIKEENYNTFLSSKFSLGKEIENALNFKRNEFENKVREISKNKNIDKLLKNINNLDDFENELTPEELNYFDLIDTVNGISQHLTELHELVLEKFTEFGLKFKPSEEELKAIEDEEDDKQIEGEEEIGPSREFGVDSINIDPKGKLGEDIKLLLHFVKNDKVEPILGFPTFYEYDHIYKLTQKIIADVVPTLKEDGNVNDVYKLAEKEIEKVVDPKYGIKPLFNLLYLMDTLDKNKQTQFTKLILDKINYLTSEITKGNKTVVDIMNISQVNSKANQMLNEWGINFKNYFVNNKGEVDFNEIHKRKELFKTFIEKEFNPISNRLNKNQLISETEIFNIINKTINILHRLGIFVTEKGFYNYVSAQDVEGDSKKLLQGTKDVLNGLFRVLEVVDNREWKLFENNDYKNPLKYQTIFSNLAQADNLFSNNDLQDTTVRQGGKQYWTYSNMSYLSLKQKLWKNSKIELQQLHNEPGNESSLYINYLLGLDIDDETERNRISQIRVNQYLNNYIFNNIQNAENSSEIADNTEIKFKDAVQDVINKITQPRIGKRGYLKTITPGSKSQSKELALPIFIDTNFESDGNGGANISERVLDIFSDYFQSDLNRAAIAYEEIKNFENETNKKKQIELGKKFIQNHHIKYNKDELWEWRDNTGKLVGNAFQNNIFSTFNIPGLTLFNEKNEPLFSIDTKLTSSQKQILKNWIKERLTELVDKNFTYLVKRDVFSENNTEDGYKSYIDSRILESYHTNNKYLSLTADFTINSLIANIEYGKMYLGSPTYYKDIDAYNKRAPSTYTDGISLRLGLTNGDRWFNVAVVDSIKGLTPSSKLLAEDLGKDNYSKVDSTDAQGYITLDRWKFLIERSNGWKDVHNNIYYKLKNKDYSALTDKERKVAAQALKGVYFVKNERGIPIHLKYSQFLLSPNIVKTNAMERVLELMEENNVDELVFSTGVKAGAFLPTKIADENGNILPKEKLRLNPYQLDNRFYKIQQDLKPKGVDDRLLSSQIKKNIFDGMAFNMNRMYDVEGFEEAFDSERMIDAINDTLGTLTDIGLNEFQEALQFNENYELKDRTAYLKNVIKQLKLTVKDDNILSALEKGISPAALPQIRKKLESVDFSLIKKNTVKTKVNGGGFIQTSISGFDQEIKTHYITKDKDGNEIRKPIEDGIKWFKDPSSLKPPMYLRDKNGKYVLNKEGKKIVTSGQILLSHSQFYKLFNNELRDKKPLYEYSGQELLELIDERLLHGVGYRIPNQGMSSNSPIEIVGLLPDGHGDAVMAFPEITTQTGSDFDIDKMYLLLPNGEFKDGKYNYIEYDHTKTIDKQTKKSLQNNLINLYRSILLHPENLENIMSPVDDPFLKDNLHNLNKEDNKLPFQDFDGLQQLINKFDYQGGKAGVGQTANHMVLNKIGQLANLILNNVNLGWGNISNKNQVELDREYSEELTQEEINKYKELFPESKIEDIKKFQISKTLTALLNEFVDIEKDNIISRGNWNTMTTNVGLLLVRAGVHPYKVNALLAQPIIKEYIEKRQNSEGITSDENSKFVSKKLKEQYLNELLNRHFVSSDKFPKKEDYADFINYETTVNNNLNEHTLSSLVQNIQNPSFEEKYLISQLKLLSRFEELLEIAKPLKQVIDALKSDTDGAMHSFTSMLIHMNNMSSIITNEHKIGGISNIKNLFLRNGKLTFSAKNYLNSVVTMKNIMENNPHIYLFGRESQRQIFNDISYSIKNQLLKDEKLGYNIEKGMFNYMISQFPEFTKYKNQDILNNLYKGLTVKLQKLKEDYKGKNFLIDQLEIKTSKGQDFVGLNDANKPDEFVKNFTNGWKELLYHKNTELKEFAEELVIFSYFQSGFNYNANQIYSYIPHEWMLLKGYDTFVADSKDIVNIEDFTDKLFKHNYDNSLLVPPIKKIKIFKNLGEINKSRGIYSDANGAVLFVTDKNVGFTENNKTRYKPFLYRPVEYIDNGTGFLSKVGGQFYKLVAYHSNNGEGIYVQTNKLGNNILQEYSLNVRESIIEENNVNPKVSEMLRNYYTDRIIDGKWIEKDVYEQQFIKPQFVELEDYLRLDNSVKLQEENTTVENNQQQLEDTTQQQGQLDMFEVYEGNKKSLKEIFEIDKKFFEQNNIHGIEDIDKLSEDKIGELLRKYCSK